MLCYIVLISVINFLKKITFQIVLFVGNKFTNLLSRPSENILILGGKTRKYPDFGEKNGKYPDFVEKTGNYPDFN